MHGVDANVPLFLLVQAGQERYESLAPIYYRRSDVAVIVYDGREESMQRAVRWSKRLSDDVPECYQIFVRNKCDLTV